VAAAPAAARSGTVTVALDRADPAAGTTRVAYRLIPRSDRSSPAQGTILFNPGGPGQAPIGQASVVRRARPLLEHRDLLLVDPRGTGRSDALRCRGDRDAALAFAAHDAFVRAIGDCGRQLATRARMYGSAAVADDFETIRAELGIDTLDLWGESHGTYLMTVFASRHPANVRSIVLSGAYPIDFDPWSRDRLAAARRAIARICTRTRSCRGTAVLDDIAHVAARLRHRPVRFIVGLGDRRYPVVLDEGALADTNTPPLAGRQVARRFAHATWAQIADAGHTPTAGSACAVRLATRYNARRPTERLRGDSTTWGVRVNEVRDRPLLP
jgi:pimeloyl-ACP methyl ester carboxylesterase